MPGIQQMFKKSLLLPSSSHAWIKFATRSPASLLLLGCFDLTHIWTFFGKVFRNCSSTSCSIICSLVWISGCNHRQQSSWIWLTAWWGPVTDRDWKYLRLWWEVLGASGFLMGVVSGFFSWSRRWTSWGFLEVSKTSFTWCIFTAWSFKGWRYSKRQAASKHSYGRWWAELYQMKKRARNLRICRNYTERLTNGLHSLTGQ